MTEPRLLTLDDLDRLFATEPKKAKTKVKPKIPQPAKPEPKYWIPEAVVLWESQWQCSCGCQGPATPQLFVRERMGKALRLRAIENPGQYGLLPRFKEEALPSHVRTCQNCFAGTSEYVTCQLALPFPEPAAEFKQAVMDAVDFAAELDAILDSIERMSGPAIPQKVRPRETPLPADYQFIPRDDVWDENSQHPTVYHYTVSGNFGPEFPHCWREEL